MDINTLFPSKYLKAEDIPAGGVVVTMNNITQEEIEPGKFKPVLHIQGKDKGIVLNKTNAMMIAHLYGPNTDSWPGKQIQLVVEPVQFQGNIVNAIRCKPSGAVEPVAVPDDLSDIPW